MCRRAVSRPPAGSAFAALNIIFAGGWLAVSAGLNRRSRIQAQQAGKTQL